MKKRILKWSLAAGCLLITLLVLVILVTNFTNEHKFIWQSPIQISLHKPLQIKKWEMLSPEVKYILPEEKEDNSIILKVSHYWPELGGVNCGNFQNGECTSKMANGERWQDWVGVAMACPKELEFGTKIKIGERVWVCKDRGSKIVKDGEAYWVDMLTPYSLANYDTVVVGEIVE